VQRDHDAAAVRPGSVAKIETGHHAIVVSSPTVMRLASHEVAGGCYGGTYVRHQMPWRVMHGYTDGDQAHGGDKQPIVSHNALPVAGVTAVWTSGSSPRVCGAATVVQVIDVWPSARL